MTIKRFLKALSLTVVVFAVIGCGGGDSDGPPPAGTPAAKPGVAPKKEAPANQVSKAEVAVEGEKKMKENIDDRYQPGKRRDPFLSILVTTEEGRSLENLPPLQRSAIEDLRLIGIVWGEYGYSAMVQTPDGKGYTIRKGTLIGPNRGKVKNITKRFISVEERYTDIFGDRKTRVVQLELHPQEEAKE